MLTACSAGLLEQRILYALPSEGDQLVSSVRMLGLVPTLQFKGTLSTIGLRHPVGLCCP